MYRELRRVGPAAAAPAKSLGQAMLQIVLADLSMSLDNVLAVAGAAAGHVWVLVAGIAGAVVLMGLAANLVASLLDRHRWIAWLGLLDRAVCRDHADLGGRPPGRGKAGGLRRAKERTTCHTGICIRF